MIGIIYHCYGYNGSQRVEIGEPIENKRVCRFCGKKTPEVTFRHEAHAVSESIGCDKFINYEECDACNKKFSAIEQDFYRRHAFDLSFANIGGKKGDRIIGTKDFTIFNINGCLQIEIKSAKKFEEKVTSIEQGKDAVSLYIEKSISKYIPQNIYKCLCKYVLGMLNPTFLKYFTGTIDWINNEIASQTLPPVLTYSPDHILEHPRIVYFIRAQDIEELPFAIGCLEFGNKGYFFIIPFCGGDDLPNTESIIYRNFKETFNKIFGNRSYELQDLSDHVKIKLRYLWISKTLF